MTSWYREKYPAGSTWTAERLADYAKFMSEHNSKPRGPAKPRHPAAAPQWYTDKYPVGSPWTTERHRDYSSWYVSPTVQPKVSIKAGKRRRAALRASAIEYLKG